MGFNSKGCSGQATDMKVCLLFVCCTIVGSHAKGYYGNQGGYRGMTLNVEDGDGKTLSFKTSSSSSEENTRNSREAGPQTSQEGGCHWPCHWKHHHCWCPHEDSEEPTKPTETLQESGEGHWCPDGCHWNGHRCVCHDKEEPTKPTETSQEGGLTWEKERGCHWPCHWKHHHCWCPHEDSEEPTKPTEEQSSVQKLVSAGLDLLKAGKKLKFNVDMKNPEALLGAKKPDEGSDEGNMCQYCIHAHCFPAVCKLNHCCFHHQEAEPSNKTSTSQESGEGHPCPPHCHHTHDHRCVCHHKDSEEQTIPTEEKSSVQKLVSAGLDLLKAGKKLKFNVDVKNPEALLSKDDTSKPKQR